MNEHQRWILCDIDGTIANDDHRVHLIRNRVDPLWHLYHEASIHDPPFQEVVDLINYLGREHSIAFLTGRPEQYREITQDWLNSQMEFLSPYELYMRPTGSQDRAHNIKRQIIEKYFQPLHKIWLALDDHKPIVDMYRSLGILCLQPKERSS